MKNAQHSVKSLHDFNNHNDPIWSTQFHYLNLETICKRIKLFESIDSEYFNYGRMLKTNGLLPETEKYLGYPNKTDKHIDLQYKPAYWIISKTAFEFA